MRESSKESLERPRHLRIPKELVWWSLHLPKGGGGTLFLQDPLIWWNGGVNPNAIYDLGQATSRLLPYLLIFGGIILLAMLIMGGFDIMTAMGNEEKLQAGKARITHALVGYLLLFGVYWLAQIVQILFKIQIL